MDKTDSSAKALVKAEDCILLIVDVQKKLAQYNKKVLLVAGIEAHICVAQTALEATSRYHVQVVGDAVASRAPHNCEIALERLRQSGITITSTEMLMYELLAKAGTDEFRAVLPLVK